MKDDELYRCAQIANALEKYVFGPKGDAGKCGRIYFQKWYSSS